MDALAAEPGCREAEGELSHRHLNSFCLSANNKLRARTPIVPSRGHASWDQFKNEKSPSLPVNDLRPCVGISVQSRLGECSAVPFLNVAGLGLRLHEEEAVAARHRLTVDLADRCSPFPRTTRYKCQRTNILVRAIQKILYSGSLRQFTTVPEAAVNERRC